MGKRYTMTARDALWTDEPHIRESHRSTRTRASLSACSSKPGRFAQNAGTELWDFALEIDRLFETGLTISDLRWLVAKRFAEHGQELSAYGAPHRSFRRGDGFFFDHATCVILTYSGTAFVNGFLREAVESLDSIQPLEVTSLVGGVTAEPDDGLRPDHGPEGKRPVTLRPCWHSMRRELLLNGELVKRFHVPAQNQEVILGAFEEERWPDHIDDPLPVSGDIDPRTRLHDAINRLNRCQTNRLLRFHGNGTGTGVCWKLFQEGATHRNRARTPRRSSNIPNRAVDRRRPLRSPASWDRSPQKR